MDIAFPSHPGDGKRANSHQNVSARHNGPRLDLPSARGRPRVQPSRCADLPKRLSSASQPLQRMDEMDDATRRMQENWLCSGRGRTDRPLLLLAHTSPRFGSSRKNGNRPLAPALIPLHPRRVIRAGVDQPDCGKNHANKPRFLACRCLRCGEVGCLRLASHFPGRVCLCACAVAAFVAELVR